MTIQIVMRELERCGTAQNRKVYARHGAQEPMFGVSYANIKSLAGKIKKDQGLATELWATGNHDARVLATYVADADAMDARTLDAWAKTLDSYVIADAFGGIASKTRFARSRADKWTRAKSDFVGQAGWVIVARHAMEATDDDVAALRERLRVIEREIHTRGNRTRHAMNMALCAIGIGCRKLRKEALATAGRIGTVEVDHGETGCKTPDAAAYIQRAAAREK